MIIPGIRYNNSYREMNIFIVGMMGSGKSRVGALLSRKLRWEFVDTDEQIEQKAGMSIARIFELEGEPAFRSMENEVILELSKKNNLVVATGGGAACSEVNRAAFKKNGITLYLKGSAQTLFARAKKSPPGLRPLLSGNAMSPERIAAILADRKKFYEEADITIDTDEKTPEELAGAAHALIIKNFHSTKPAN